MFVKRKTKNTKCKNKKVIQKNDTKPVKETTNETIDEQTFKNQNGKKCAKCKLEQRNEKDINETPSRNEGNNISKPFKKTPTQKQNTLYDKTKDDKNDVSKLSKETLPQNTNTIYNETKEDKNNIDKSSTSTPSQSPPQKLKVVFIETKDIKNKPSKLSKETPEQAPNTLYNETKNDKQKVKMSPDSIQKNQNTISNPLKKPLKQRSKSMQRQKSVYNETKDEKNDISKFSKETTEKVPKTFYNEIKNDKNDILKQPKETQVKPSKTFCNETKDDKSKVDKSSTNEPTPKSIQKQKAVFNETKNGKQKVKITPNVAQKDQFPISEPLKMPLKQRSKSMQKQKVTHNKENDEKNKVIKPLQKEQTPKQSPAQKQKVTHNKTRKDEQEVDKSLQKESTANQSPAQKQKVTHNKTRKDEQEVSKMTPNTKQNSISIPSKNTSKPTQTPNTLHNEEKDNKDDINKPIKSNKNPSPIPKQEESKKQHHENSKNKENEKSIKSLKIIFVLLNKNKETRCLTIDLNLTIKDVISLVSTTFNIDEEINLKYKNEKKIKVTIDLKKRIHDIANKITQKINNKRYNVLYIDINQPQTKTKPDLNTNTINIDNNNNDDEDSESNEPTTMINDSLEEYKINQNDYKVIKVIGSGSYGTVQLVQHKMTKKLYAAKCIYNHIDITNDNDNDNNVNDIDNREINIMKILNFPTIIKFYGYSIKDFHNNDSIIIFMEYASNFTLEQYLKKRNSHNFMKNNTQMQKILIDIASGMSYMHHYSIMHRDLKPANILLNELNNAFICDFGLAKFYKDGLIHSGNKGTPAYMAPEFIKDDEYDLKSDVYSFGIILFEVLMGKSPYPKDATAFQIYKKISNATVPQIDKLAKVRPLLRDLTNRCLSFSPNNRPEFIDIAESLAYDKNYYIDDDVNGDEVVEYADMLKKTFFSQNK